MNGFELLPRVDALREELHKIVDRLGDILHPDVIAKSQQLDEMIVACYKSRMNQSGRPKPIVSE